MSQPTGSLTYISAPHGLVSVYDQEAFTELDFQFELDRVHADSEIERAWMDEAGLEPYASDPEILAAAEAGQLVKVTSGVGYIVRPMLANWTLERSNPGHVYHYSPPYLRPEAFDLLEEIGEDWAAEMGVSSLLSITSLARSDIYQDRLARRDRKITIINEDEAGPKLLSSHQVGLAFDIDGNGHYREDVGGNIHAVNPLTEGYNSTIGALQRHVLREILGDKVRQGRLNSIEELPATLEHCFHNCTKPLALAA